MEYLPGVPISHSPPALVFGKDVTGVKASPLTDERSRAPRSSDLI